ncbi:hypothetical protein KAR91_11630 [Candidatus Pacearchaeota archaeon]|nr:hypothetical protein [Candidatus Pacearchaeota archaeon]
MGHPKYTAARFKRKYPPLLAKGMSRPEIALKLDVSVRTLERYLAKEDYVGKVTAEMEKINERDIVIGESNSKQIITVAYKLFKKAINAAIEKKDFPEARRLSLDALKIAKTEAEVKKVFFTIGQVNFGPTEINITQIRQEQIQEIWRLLCPNCQTRILKQR